MVILRYLLLSLTLLPLSTFSHAQEVYRWVDANGVVHFGDKGNAPDHAEAISVKPVTIVPAIKVPKQRDKRAARKLETTARSIEILNPADGSAMHSGSGDVGVLLAIEPPLNSEEIIRAHVDGNLVFQGNTQSFTAKGLHRGTHRMSVEILGRLGIVEARASSSFTVHRPRAGK